MAWQAKFNPELKIIELTYTGTITPADLEEAYMASAELATQAGTAKFLADCSEMIGGSYLLTDLYNLIAKFEERRGAYVIKEALILPISTVPREDVKFYETACMNRGFNMKVFSTVEDALVWLLS